jgi:hypothetical protein
VVCGDEEGHVGLFLVINYTRYGWKNEQVSNMADQK